MVVSITFDLPVNFNIIEEYVHIYLGIIIFLTNKDIGQNDIEPETYIVRK